MTVKGILLRKRIIREFMNGVRVVATKQKNGGWEFKKVFESKRGLKVFKTTARNTHRKSPNGKTKSVTNNRLTNEDNDKVG
jgi:hypothetical protein